MLHLLISVFRRTVTKIEVTKLDFLLYSYKCKFYKNILDDKKDKKKDKKDKKEEKKDSKLSNHAAAVIGIALIAMGEDIGR